MRSLKVFFALGLAVTVGACGSIEVPSRNAPFENVRQLERTPSSDATGAVFDAIQTSYDVQQINVIVPRELLVSEANSYYPRGDIVWRGDPFGDRHAQIEAIFDTAMARGTQSLSAGVPIILDVQVLRFHALTEKTRYSIGGTHAIKFGLSIRSAQTGLLLSERKVIEADLDGYGGQEAVDAERQGLTQKVRITDHLAKVINTELTTAGGYVNSRVGFFR